MGFFPLPESEARKIHSLLSFPFPCSVIDPCAGQGTALNLITEGAQVERHGIELDTRRAEHAAATGIRVIQGNVFDTHAKVESFSLLYLNPPYDSEINLTGNRRMERMFLEHTHHWLVQNGILVFVIPFEQLNVNFRQGSVIASQHGCRLRYVKTRQVGIGESSAPFDDEHSLLGSLSINWSPTNADDWRSSFAWDPFAVSTALYQNCLRR
jgi:hypothetical protein